MHQLFNNLSLKTRRALLAFGAVALVTTELAWAEITVVEPVEGEAIEASNLSADELKQLAGPVALYPDDLLAIVLPASTYPLQVVAAARFRENEANDGAEPNEDWDESIVALLNYPEALALLNDDINWTWELGQAVIAQEAELMSAIQAFRQEAYAAGNIDSDDKQNVYVKEQRVIIEPVEENVVHVPYYDTAEVVVYQPRRVYHYYPHSYPLYYYPYASYSRYYDHGFWGLSSFFTLSWAHYNLHHYSHRHHHHRYYGRHYNRHHFRHTARYHTPRYHKRRWSHRARHDYAYNGHWRPAKRHLGSRPHYEKRLKRRDLASGHRIARGDGYRKQRHIERRGRHEYRALREDRRGFGRRGLEERRATHRAANERALRGRDHIRNRDDRPSVGGVRAGQERRIAQREANRAAERRQIRRIERRADERRARVDRPQRVERQSQRAQRVERSQREQRAARLERRQSQARVERRESRQRVERRQVQQRPQRSQRVERRQLERSQRVERRQAQQRPQRAQRVERRQVQQRPQRAQRVERRQVQQRPQRSQRVERRQRVERTQRARAEGRREIRANRSERQARSGGGRFREHAR